MAAKTPKVNMERIPRKTVFGVNAFNWMATETVF